MTLKYLQEKQLIPQKQPIQLGKEDLSLPEKSLGEVLVKTSKGLIYYGHMNQKGPQDDAAICIFPDSSYYRGQFDEGKINGYGEYLRFEGSHIYYEYKGDWHSGLPHGKGREEVAGNVYEGQFQQGVKEGLGKLKFADGSRFKGAFSSNKIQGEGKYIKRNNEWKGEWVNGYLQGKGRQLIKNHENKSKNSNYQGNFRKGAREGEGKFMWGTNKSYTGEFKDGQIHGSGVLRVGRNMFEGEWRKGVDIQLKKKMIQH